MIAIFGVGPLMTAIRPDRFAQAVRANRATDISIATFGEYSASPTSYDAFFHGLGQTLPSAGRSANVRSQTVSGSLSVGSRASDERRKRLRTGYQFGLVGFERGRLRILDAEGLDAYACGCNRPLGS
jgi:hypothetical protein